MSSRRSGLRPSYHISSSRSGSFLVHHCCLTAYLHGAILSLDPGANVYDMAFVGSAPAPLPPSAECFSPFQLDAYGYPPPFLLIPRALFVVTRDFLSLRMLFSAGSLALGFYACAAAAKTLGGVAERRIWLLAPFFMANPFAVVLLQVGNFHLASVSLCLLTWVTLERQKDKLTGTLLAAATLSKISPGVLGIVLLMQKRWRAAAMTALAAVAICALSVAVLGTIAFLLLVMTAEVRSRRGAIAFVCAWLSFSLLPPMPDPKTAIAVSLARMVALYAFLVWLVLRRERAYPSS